MSARKSWKGVRTGCSLVSVRSFCPFQKWTKQRTLSRTRLPQPISSLYILLTNMIQIMEMVHHSHFILQDLDDPEHFAEDREQLFRCSLGQSYARVNVTKPVIKYNQDYLRDLEPGDVEMSGQQADPEDEDAILLFVKFTMVYVTIRSHGTSSHHVMFSRHVLLTRLDVLSSRYDTKSGPPRSFTPCLHAWARCPSCLALMSCLQDHDL